MRCDGWCDRSLVVTVQGPAGQSRTTVPGPFARIGSHQDSDVVLSGAPAPRRCFLLHASREGIFCVDLAENQTAGASLGRWLQPDDSVEAGPFRIAACWEDEQPLPDAPVFRLDAKGSAEPPYPVVNVSAHGRRLGRRLLTRRLTLIGRHRPSHVRLSGPRVSACHCALYWESGRLWAIDLLSSNGTELDGRLVASAELARGKVLHFGGVELTLVGVAEGGQAERRAEDRTVVEALSKDEGCEDSQQPHGRAGQLDLAAAEERPQHERADSEAARTELEAEREDLHRLKLALQREGEETRLQQERAQAILAEERSRLADLRGELERGLGDLEARKLAFEDDRQSREAEWARRFETLRAEHAELAAAREGLDARRLDLEDHLERLEADRREAEVRWAKDLEGLDCERAELADLRSQLEAGLRDLGARTLELEGDRQAAEAAAARQLQEIQTQQSELRSARTRLEADLRESRQRQGESEQDRRGRQVELEAQCKALQRQRQEIQTLRREVQSERREIQTGRHALEAERQEIESDRKKLRTQREELQAQREDLQTQREDLGTVRQRLDTEHEAIRAEREALCDGRRALGAEQTKLARQQQEADNLAQHQQDLQGLLAEHRRREDAWEADRRRQQEALTHEVARLASQEEELQASMAAWREHQIRAEADLAERDRDLSTQEQGLVERRRRLDTERRRLEKREADTAAQHRAAQDGLRSQGESLQRLEDELRRERQEFREERDGWRSEWKRRQAELDCRLERLESSGHCQSPSQPSSTDGLVATAASGEEAAPLDGSPQAAGPGRPATPDDPPVAAADAEWADDRVAVDDTAPDKEAASDDDAMPPHDAARVEDAELGEEAVPADNAAQVEEAAPVDGALPVEDTPPAESSPRGTVPWGTRVAPGPGPNSAAFPVPAPSAPPSADRSSAGFRRPSYTRRRRSAVCWLAAALAGMIGSAAAGAALWCHREPVSTATAVVEVPQSDLLLGSASDDASDGATGETQPTTLAELVRSPKVLVAALAHGGASPEAPFGPQSSPQDWLARELRVDSADQPGLVSLRLSGSSQREVSALVDAVAKALVQEVTRRAEARKARDSERLAELDRLLAESTGEIQAEWDRLRQFAQDLSSPDPDVLAAERRAVLVDLTALQAKRPELPGEQKECDREDRAPDEAEAPGENRQESERLWRASAGPARGKPRRQEEVAELQAEADRLERAIAEVKAVRAKIDQLTKARTQWAAERSRLELIKRDGLERSPARYSGTSVQETTEELRHAVLGAAALGFAAPFLLVFAAWPKREPAPGPLPFAALAARPPELLRTTPPAPSDAGQQGRVSRLHDFPRSQEHRWEASNRRP